MINGTGLSGFVMAGGEVQKWVLVIYTGGTIGMKREVDGGLELFIFFLNTIPKFYNFDYENVRKI